MDVFQRLNVERGITILLITHEHDIAEYGTRTIAFRDGHIVSDKHNTVRRMAKDELAALPPPTPATATTRAPAQRKRAYDHDATVHDFPGGAQGAQPQQDAHGADHARA